MPSFLLLSVNGDGSDGSCIIRVLTGLKPPSNYCVSALLTFTRYEFMFANTALADQQGQSFLAACEASRLLVRGYS